MIAFLGIFTLLAISILCSENRKAISYKTLVSGILLQFLLAFFLIKFNFLNSFFNSLAEFFVYILSFTEKGSEFLFGELVNTKKMGFILAFKVLPTIVFFSALSSLLFHLGILQKIVKIFAFIMSRLMGLSGPESLSAAGNIFLGQTEAPLLVKPYISKMSRSELFSLMAGGMATIAGGVFAAFIGILGGEDPEKKIFFARHLLTASILSAPAALVFAKAFVPETQKVNKNLEIKETKKSANSLDAIATGTSDGIQLAFNVGAMLLVFISLVALGNTLFSEVFGNFLKLNSLAQNITKNPNEIFDLNFIFSIFFLPFSYLIGVPKEDLFSVSQLIGTKTVVNEFVAYLDLEKMKNTGEIIHEKSILIATYALCGFSNLSSIGIQIGGLSILAPERRAEISSLAFKAMIAGTFACLLTAAIAGLLTT